MKGIPQAHQKNASAKMSARMMMPPPTATAMVMIVFLESAEPVLPVQTALSC